MRMGGGEREPRSLAQSIHARFIHSFIGGSVGISTHFTSRDRLTKEKETICVT